MNQYQEPTEAEIRDAQRAIAHRCDGPLDVFVIIARATRYALDTGKHRAAAEAAMNALEEFGFLSNANSVSSLER